METMIISSLEKVFPDFVTGYRLSYASIFLDESFSFQLCYKSSDGIYPVFVKISSDLPENFFEEYKVCYVPVECAASKNHDNYYDRTTPGMFPDILRQRNINNKTDNIGFHYQMFCEQNEKNLLTAFDNCYNSIWFTVNPKHENIPPKNYKITISVFNGLTNKKESEDILNLNVINETLSNREFNYTSWFYPDCLSDIYNVKIFSKKHFAIMNSFIKEAAKSGMNMILLPAFTPPIDTPVGKDRKTVQLVKVKVINNTYIFDFSKMEKYIDMCLNCGIEKFEHSHLFTQWGAKHAPKIIADVQGKNKQIFGWQTDAFDKRYADFLNSYLEALMTWLKRKKLIGKVFFHVSDEPTKESIDYYNNARKIILNYIGDNPVGDAISDYEFIENGLDELPIVNISSPDLNKFIQSKKDFWIYYCGECLTENLSNRMISNTSTRNRILGLQAYVSGAKGFLHWGYNYYYDTLSQGLFDPKTNPCGYCGRASMPGASFVVYPSEDGTALPSIRMKVFSDAINDYKALYKLEELIGRTQTLDFIESCVGKIDFHTFLTSKELLFLREQLAQKIVCNIK